MEPPFYTLSSGSSSMCDTPLTPPLTTHDTSRSTYHLSDISLFGESLQDAADRAFPNRGRSRYHNVNVCLIRWEEDELQVKTEIDRLHDVFQELYGFNTEIWLIPSSSPQIKLTTMTCNFLQKFDEEGNLFIAYYGGHGKINDARQNQWWCRSTADSPYVDWSAIQILFGSAVSDVLILLDCCAAASSAAGSGTGTMEAIAACGWEARAPPPGPYSFTHNLIEVLEDWANKPSFSAAMLHTEVLFVLKQKRPERGRDGKRLEWCSTPIHWVYTNDPKAPGIEISSLRTSNAIGKTIEREPFPPPRSTSYIDAMDLDEDTAMNPLMDCRPSGDYRVPHVLISLALEGDQGELDVSACRRWLADFPALVKYASIEGVYKGYSILLTLSVPVMVWDLLPDHPACSFIGYIVSPNKFAAEPNRGRSFSRTKSLKSYSILDPQEHDSSYGSEFSWGPSSIHSCSLNESDNWESFISNDSVNGSVRSDTSCPRPIPGKSLIAWMIENKRDSVRSTDIEGEEMPSSKALEIRTMQTEEHVQEVHRADQQLDQKIDERVFQRHVLPVADRGNSSSNVDGDGDFAWEKLASLPESPSF